MNATQLKQHGIQTATDKANSDNPNWSNDAYDFFENYARTHLEFMTEDVRIASEGIVPDANGRAWGGVSYRAKSNGIVEVIGIGKTTKTPTSHNANANIYRSKIFSPVIKGEFVQESLFVS